MKIRNGFVSNSSSASFVIAAFKLDKRLTLDDLNGHGFYVYPETLTEGLTYEHEAFNGDFIKLTEAGDYVIAVSHAEEECDEDGDCQFTDELHTNILSMMDKYKQQLVKSIDGYGRDG